MRFVPRYPDPEEAEGSDTWDNVSDEPEPETLGEQLEAKKAPKIEPVYRFPIMNPTDTQIQNGIELRERRDRMRMIRNRIMAIILGIFLFNDVLTVWSVWDTKSRIAAGLMEPPFVVLVVDAGKLVDGPSALLPSPSAGAGAGAVPPPSAVVPSAATNGTTVGGVQVQPPPHYARRPLPKIKQFKMGYPIPITTFIAFFA
jgi:hypothetical protein